MRHPFCMRTPVIAAAVAVACYVALDWLSYIHPTEDHGITPWNPQPSVAVILLMLLGQRMVPVVFAGVLLADILVRGAPAPVPATIAMCLVLTLGYAAIAAALKGRFSVSWGLETRRDVVRLVSIVLAGTLLTGVFYLAALRASGLTPANAFPTPLFRFWIGDAVGMLVTLPLALMALSAERRAQVRGLVSRETFVQIVAVGLALWAVFARPVADQVKFFYLLFLPLVWIAARHGLAGACCATLLIQVAVIVAVVGSEYPALTVFELQALLIALTVTGLFLGVAVDEQRRAESELRRGLRMAAAGETAAALAHELNQPLTALTNYARASALLAQSGRDPAALEVTLRKVVAEAERAASVVQRLRDFFRTGATRLENTALDAVATRVVDAMQGRALEMRVELILDAKPIPAFLGDPVQMEVVLRNLITNALEAAAAGTGTRRVTVRLHATKMGVVHVLVADSGFGVKAEEAERIFEPFASGRANGMGMGLAIARAIVEAHGGRVWAEPGGGGLFHVSLPAAESHG